MRLRIRLTLNKGGNPYGTSRATDGFLARLLRISRGSSSHPSSDADASASSSEPKLQSLQPVWLESRIDLVLRFIEANPGMHLRKTRTLDLPMGATQYYLHPLETRGKIVSLRRGLFRRFYPGLNFGEKDSEILGILFSET